MDVFGLLEYARRQSPTVDERVRRLDGFAICHIDLGAWELPLEPARNGAKGRLAGLRAGIISPASVTFTSSAKQGDTTGNTVGFAMIAARQETETEDHAPDKSEPRRMLSEKQILEIVPVGRTTLYRMEKAGRFPRSTYISPNRRVWFADEILAWQRAVDERNLSRGRGRGRRRVSASPS